MPRNFAVTGGKIIGVAVFPEPDPEVLHLQPQPEGCITAEFDYRKYEAGIDYSNNFHDTMKPLLSSEESIPSLIAQTMFLIKERVNQEGACYRTIVSYRGTEFYVIDDGSVISFLMPEDFM